jgi:hypothetical protein
MAGFVGSERELLLCLFCLSLLATRPCYGYDACLVPLNRIRSLRMVSLLHIQAANDDVFIHAYWILETGITERNH